MYIHTETKFPDFGFDINLELGGGRVDPPVIHTTMYKPVPYSRAEVTEGWGHLGGGQFFKGHIAWHLHEIMAQTRHRDCGIYVVSTSSESKERFEALEVREGVYCVVTRSPQGEEAQDIGSVKTWAWAGTNPFAAVMRLSQLPIVSMTLSENGYCINKGTSQFEPERDKRVEHDYEHPFEAPRSVFGLLSDELAERMRRLEEGEDLDPQVILSCDNLIRNGRVLRDALLAFAEKRNPEVAEHLDELAVFPSTVVDRIVPLQRVGLRAEIEARYGITDPAPVETEPFAQWVIEDLAMERRDGADPLRGGRAVFGELQKLGVLLVSDIEPFERMKLGLLNLPHTAISPLAVVEGFPTISDTVSDLVFGRYVEALQNIGVIPVLERVPHINYEEYSATVRERFRNEVLGHTPQKIVTGTSGKLTDRLVWVVERHFAGSSGGSESALRVLAIPTAGWLYYLSKTEEDLSKEPNPRDPVGERVRRMVHSGCDVSECLGVREIFGDQIPGNTRYHTLVKEAVGDFENLGPRDGLAKQLELVLMGLGRRQ